MIETPYPTLDEMLAMMGEAGLRMAEIDASEGAAGNISVCMRWPVEVREHFPQMDEIELPLEAPNLVGATILVTGSGRRLREIIDNPAAHLAAVVVEEGGKKGKIYTSPDCRFVRPTSEFNSHLAVHNDKFKDPGTNFLAVIHAQPIHITFLSQIPCYQDVNYLSRHLLRWQPELIDNFPDGIGYLPFSMPGSEELMAGNVKALQDHRLVVWAKHGIMTYSDVSMKRAADKVEYAETAARYEFMNLSLGEIGQGLSVDEIREICRVSNIEQDIF